MPEENRMADSRAVAATAFVRPSLASNLENQWQRQNLSVACDYRFVVPAIVAIDLYFSRYGQSLISEDNSVDSINNIGSSGFSRNPLRLLNYAESKIPN